MILQALNEHYRLLLEEDAGVAPPGYSPAKVTHMLILSREGALLDMASIAVPQGRKSAPRVLMVPEQVKRTSGIAANILCDNASYVLGVDRDKQGKPRLAAEKNAAFKEKNLAFLRDIPGESAAAIGKFLQTWTPALEHPVVARDLEGLLAGSNIVFKIDGAPGYVHEDSRIRQAWTRSAAGADNSPVLGQCLVLGGRLPIARIHPAIKGVAGAQTSGASVVSFNADAFTSYGKAQSYNAPVSEEAAFAYGTALNYLTANAANRVRLADTTMVFWADKKGARKEEALLAWFLDPAAEAGNDGENRRLAPGTEQQAKAVWERIRLGLSVQGPDAEFDPEARCFLLGLAPNAARLSVRFWQVGRFGEVLAAIARHYTDMNIDGMERIGGMASPRRTLKALAAQEESKNIPPLLGGQLLKSILSGRMYPQTLYNAALTRCRTGGGHGGATTIRAAVIKAFLLRRYRIQNQPEEAMITVSLNEGNTSPAYLLGRLFSLLEKLQQEAMGKELNATIRDRYFGAASAAPGSVFPLLLRLARHHVAKADNLSAWPVGSYTDGKIQEVIGKLDIDRFPAHLSLEEQGQFILGYYQQRQANYRKNKTREEKEADKDE